MLLLDNTHTFLCLMSCIKLSVKTTFEYQFIFMRAQIKYVIIALGFSLPMFSQSIDRQVLASAGKDFTATNGSLEFTLGETVTNTMLDVTNGFHQPVFSITRVNQLSEELGLSIFPNPSNQVVFVKFNTLQQHTLIELCDVSGQVLQSNQLDGYQQSIDLNVYANGAYYLKINQTQFYKIIKLQ